MRAVGLGACSGMARIGAIVTPFVAQVSTELFCYSRQVTNSFLATYC